MGNPKAEESEGEAMPFGEIQSQNRWRGCLFSMTGQENRIASKIETLWPGARARSVSAAKRRSTNGVKRIEIEVIMQGYVFFEVDETFVPSPPFPDGVIRLLTTMDGSWQLSGHDDEFARWLFLHDGVLLLSRAYMQDEQIIIRQGPLKELEQCIQKIDKRNRNALVQFEVGGHQILIWLPFELEEAHPNTEKQVEVMNSNG